ncbi:unnamed protein product [marine sediment metagenome]|uniref:Uncharacterized protein n=1 Tax=marine sediment metagenome TaxID=412755 RepID=X0WEV7_9ZZZZ
MIIAEAAARVLKVLEQTDEEEYDIDQAVMDVNQAIGEIADEAELSSLNTFSQFSLAADDYSDSDEWAVVPGRAPITDVLGASIGEIGYIKHAWLSVESANAEFKERDIRYLLDNYGDDEGQPTRYAVDGDFFYWRPVGAAGTEFIARLFWAKMPPEYGRGEEPTIIAQAPYAVIYRACALACIWLVDDDRAPRFDKMAQRLIDKYIIRDSMHGDSRMEMEDFNG